MGGTISLHLRALIIVRRTCYALPMRLSDLKTGEKAVVVKVFGHGGFRKRIIEMGFVRGKVVEALQNAPLQDPVKYQIMGYQVSLRKSEASNIEVVGQDAVQEKNETDQYNGVLNEDLLRKIALTERKHINIALVGNPNCGKTSIFNYASGAHEHVGNYSGVTVDAKEGQFSFRDYTFRIVDLPGTYSLSAYSPEELYVRKHIVEAVPDIVVNVVDAANLERNLFLTTQLIDMNVRMVVALNMWDELVESGDRLDYIQLSKLLGAPVIPTIGRKGWGLDTLFHVLIKVYEGTDFFTSKGEINLKSLQELHAYYHEHDLPHDLLEEIEEEVELKQQHDDAGKLHMHEYPVGSMTRHVHVNHGPVIEKSLSKIRAELAVNTPLSDRYSLRFLSIKLLEGDAEIERMLKDLPNAETIKLVCAQSAEQIAIKLKEDPESALTNAKYGFIAGALKETYKPAHQKKATSTRFLDRILLNQYISYPIFLFFMYLMFQATFSLGAYPMDWIDRGVAALASGLDGWMAAGPLKDLLLDGVIGGIGGVIVFLPNILILYFFISLMEDSGYMARAAFIMDKIMHKMGLHGKSFIPMIMGFGCTVPAIMSTRTIENRNSRMITMLVTPLMSCSARLPVYLLLAGTFFPKHAGLVLFSIYLLGILMAVLLARIFKRTLFNKEDTPFVMELPPYRWPTLRGILRHMWEKSAQYLKKMGTVILVASIAIWFLGNYPKMESSPDLSSDQMRMEQQEASYIGMLGKWMEPVMRPLGFDWKTSVALLTGVAAKEVVVSTLGVLYVGHEDDELALSARLQSEIKPDGSTAFDQPTALSLMVFVLLYFPCIATIIAIKNESGSWKWGVFTIVYTVALAWIMAFVVYELASFLI